MRIQQISVFVENHPGRLVSILEVLEKKGISIRALSISESAEFGIVRMILDNPDEGLEALRQAGFTTRMDWILSAEIPDVPGGLLNSVAKPLTEAGINLKYFYAYIEQATGDKAMVVLKTDDLEKAEQILKSLAG
ncbi:MAG: ACT domain-containing protein [Dehalococcoidia bacterium]|nr:MAG: ACT domain-containing protein [Dehalococcoidia bacterium]